MNTKKIVLFPLILTVFFSSCSKKKNNSTAPENENISSTSPSLDIINVADIKSAKIIGVIYSEPSENIHEIKSNSFSKSLTNISVKTSVARNNIDKFIAEESLIEASFTGTQLVDGTFALLCSCKNKEDNNFYSLEIRANEENKYVFPSGKFITSDLKLFDKNKNDITKKQLSSIETVALKLSEIGVKSPIFNTIILKLAAIEDLNHSKIEEAKEKAAKEAAEAQTTKEAAEKAAKEAAEAQAAKEAAEKAAKEAAEAQAAKEAAEKALAEAQTVKDDEQSLREANAQKELERLQKIADEKAAAAKAAYEAEQKAAAERAAKIAAEQKAAEERAAILAAQLKSDADREVYINTIRSASKLLLQNFGASPSNEVHKAVILYGAENNFFEFYYTRTNKNINICGIRSDLPYKYVSKTLNFDEQNNKYSNHLLEYKIEAILDTNSQFIGIEEYNDIEKIVSNIFKNSSFATFESYDPFNSKNTDLQQCLIACYLTLDNSNPYCSVDKIVPTAIEPIITDPIEKEKIEDDFNTDEKRKIIEIITNPLKKDEENIKK